MEFHVDGMTCAHCVRAITQALMEVDPQALVQVDLAGKRVSVQGAISVERGVAAITDAGYIARPLADAG